MRLNLCTPRRKRNTLSGSSKMRNGLRKFSYEELKQVTKDFSEELGSGCFGSVYRGMLPDSTLVAVKKLVKKLVSEFETELEIWIEVLESLQHINMLPVIGFCYEGGEMILVYEYMPRRSLNLHLFQQPNEDFQVLDWNRRYQIALGIARGLNYLHGRRLVYHSSVKPENIILDSSFCPKLTDWFGWLFWSSDDYHRILTTGTRTNTSYIAPEVLSGDRLSFEAIVYSYGMALFEMISGIRNSENGETPKSFPSRVASLIREGDVDILSVLDSRLGRNADEEEVLRVCKVACWCVHIDPQHRPSMELVIGVLEGVIDDDIINLPPN